MKWIWSTALVIILTANFLLEKVLAANNSESNLHRNIKTIIDEYLLTSGKKEKITGITASIYLPKNHATHSYYTGNIGYPPVDQPITANHLIELGSITKSFASALILQLEAEKKLSIHDKIEKWFPEYSEWKNVTVEQLLNMTSDIPSYTRNQAFGEQLERNLQKNWNNQELLNYAYPKKPLVVAKNRFDYSNTNYILAGLIVEKITHDTFENQLEKRIFSPFHFKNTYYLGGPNATKLKKQINSRMIHGYFYDPDTKKMVDVTGADLTWAGPAGAMIANTAEVIKWVQLLYSGDFLPIEHRKKGVQELKTIVSIKTGKPIHTVTSSDPKAFGLGVGYRYDPDTKKKFWWYEGSGLGYRTAYIWDSCSNVTVAVGLNNKAGEGNPHSLEGDRIFELNVALYKKIVETFPEYRCK